VKGKVLQTGGLAAANAVLNPGVTTVPSLELGDVLSSWSVMKTWKRKPLTSVNLS